jgi:hypothetical protein
MNLRVLTLIAALAALLCAPAVHAQLELAAPKRFNPLHSEGAAYGVTGPETPGQFSSAGVTSGGTAPGAVGLYRDAQNRVIPEATVELRRARIGNAFASGVPRYYLGEKVTPPLTDAENNPAPEFYWRQMPVRPGESFVNPNGGNLTDTLGVQMPNTSGSSGTPLPALTAGQYEDFYYSPHAERVFASQSGAVEIWWVSAAPINGVWKFRKESFNVSGATSVPVRIIYWTEKAFDGPRVLIPSGRIELAQAVYTAKFPSVVETEHQQLGAVINPDPSAQPAEEKRTLWYDKINGNGQFSAYNLEGRILVEYLGPEISPGKHEFLGADVVEVVKATRSQTNEIELGQEVLPRQPGANLVAAPVLNLSAAAQSPFYATAALSNGTLVYYAERENLNPDLVQFYWLENLDAGIDLLPEGETPGLSIPWPKYKDRYKFVWPQDLSSYAYVTTDSTGSDATTGLSFPSTSLPEIIYQDDPAQTEAGFDSLSQRLVVGVGSDQYNRTLLKFSNGNLIWYQLLYTQAEDRPAYLEPDQGASLAAGATVGTRIERPSGDYALAGAISGGTGYMEDAYINPYAMSVEAAESGAIIPVNAVPGNRELTVRWFQKIEPPAAMSESFVGFYVPSKVGRYTVSYPVVSEQEDSIVMASNLGTGGLTAAQAAGVIYQQNDPAVIGFNPNEEHAVKKDKRFWALRDDLNVTGGDGYSSEPFVLVAYTDPEDGRPAMRPFRVLREDEQYSFQYSWTAGSKLQGPMPLPLMQLPQRANGRIANTEVSGEAEATSAAASAPGTYGSFTFEDRQGYKWLYRGPHAGGAPTLGMQWYYPMAADFYFPGLASPPAVGTALPFLRPLLEGSSQGDAVDGTAMTVSYSPVWPDSVPSLHVAETLTLAKFGLPDVRNQKSAEILYQQSIAKDGIERSSVTLHDPTRYKLIPLADTGLPKIPGSIRTSVYQGKTYFQGLPPHLQSRFFFDPLASSKGSLILKGEFYDEIAGDDYLDLNVLSSQDLADLKALAENEDNTVKSQWESGIDALKTRIETFIENPVQRGSYIVSSNSSLTYDAGAGALAIMPDADTARDSYALTANGRGEGYVTLMFANGRNPGLTPVGDPPMMQIIRVVPELYNGDLKVRLSSNPLDEKVSLRHSSDFAAQPEDYEFEWYHAPPSASGTQPPTYTYTNQTILGNPEVPASREWRSIQAPALARPPIVDYPADLVSLPTQVVIHSPAADASSTLPGIVFRANQPVDFSSGIPAKITFSANLEALDGFVLYVNGAVAVVHRNGVPALDGLLAENAYDLRLIRATTVGDLPIEGESLVVVAEVAGVLHFRIFDAAGAQVIDTDESELAGKTTELTALRGRLSGLWATTNLLNSDKSTVVASASSIVGFDLDQDASAGLSADGLQKQFAVGEGYFIKGSNIIEVALYSAADAGILSNVDFRLEGSTRNDQVIASGSPWAKATGSPALDNRATVGGSPTAPLGSPLLVMSDNFFTVRYRANEFLADGVTPNPAYVLTGGAWTNWTRPALVEGWIKRVLAAINPFNQRMSDLYNNAVNTDVSLLTQAGTRWEGDIALTLDAINDYGLIEIYETVLKRGKGISIKSGYDYGPANDALLLAAGYLSDLYTILGNEAYADAANPTISIDDVGSSTEVNTSRFSFEGQVASVLEEELALLRGRDDFLSPQVTQSPFYNRLFWNYTRGIDSGEALYATNYNIKEKVGSATADGSINAADAQRMFPQGHGDSYGHYLTALKGYYQLLTEPKFTWTPRIESLNILGNTVSVDYQDERKFAKAASNVARTAEQIVNLTFRQQYRDDAADGWESFRDGKPNAETGNTRHWGLDAWVSRANQGAYYHWAVGNAILPDVDAVNTGIQKIDRTTEPELQLLVLSAESLQTTLDNANAHLNPLGLSPGAVAFDIDPALLRAGKSHFEQVYDRSLGAVLNAKGAFDQAARMTRLLRNQENTVDEFNTALQDQERAINYQLIDIYGTPYPGDVGPGKTYAQGYAGPDLNNWFVVDRPSPDFGTHHQSVMVTARVPTRVGDFVGFNDFIDGDSAVVLNSILYPLASFVIDSQIAERSFSVAPSPFGQFADEWMPGIDLGKRSLTGKLQQALNDAQLAYMAVKEAGDRLENSYSAFDRQAELLGEVIAFHDNSIGNRETFNDTNRDFNRAIAGLKVAQALFQAAKETQDEVQTAVIESLPKVNGVANDVTSSIRGVSKAASTTLGKIFASLKIGAQIAEGVVKVEQSKLGREFQLELERRGYSREELQLAYDLDLSLQEMLVGYQEVAQLALKMQQASEEVRSVMAQGDRIQLEREIFRKRAATVVQGYRTNDLTFRTFRDEALEQYRTLFDLASRYTYLATKSYDYETGLLGTPQGQAVISRIVSARALGDLAGGVPQATVSTLGDAGLAGTMAQLQADFSVAEGRLGINNPDTNGTLISIRQELFRILNNPAVSEDDTAWQQTLEQHMVSDLMSDPDIAAQCRNLRKADGSAVPGIMIPFSSTIEHGKNFFGLPTAGGDHLFSATNFATKIYSVGVLFDGYVGMDPYAEFSPGAGSANTNDPNVLSATPYLYLIPVGVDKMLAPPLGDTGIERAWMVQDQALPLPYNLGANAFSSTQFFSANGTLTEQPWILRKHQAFRAVDDAAFFYGGLRAEFGSSRLVGRSVWNTQWKIVIPAYGLLNDEQTGLTRFAATVDDIKLFFRTYSNSGN